jgi:hypothetical protein
MNLKYQLINSLISKFGLTSYLEIGLGPLQETWKFIEIDHKVCVDVIRVSDDLPTFLGGSDDFFEINKDNFDLIYIDKSGKLVLNNQKEVLDFLTVNKDKERFVPPAVDRGEQVAIAELVTALKSWLSSQSVQTEVMADGTTKETMGTAVRDLFGKIKKGNQMALDFVKQDGNVDQKFQVDKFDLVAWVLVSK